MERVNRVVREERERGRGWIDSLGSLDPTAAPNASTPGPPLWCQAPMAASSTSKINNHHSTIIDPSLEKTRGQSLNSPSVFASLRLRVRPKDPRRGEGTPEEGFSPRRQARKGSDQEHPQKEPGTNGI